MRSLAFAVLAALACAGAAQAQDRPQPVSPRPPAQVAPQPVPPKPPTQMAPPPLSQEDAELVKELALLEQLDLVKNLELFQPDPDAGKEPQRQP